MYNGKMSFKMKELRKIRRKIYQDIKGMDKEQMVNYFRMGADKFRKELAQFHSQNKPHIP